MFCSSCGKEVAADRSFCTNCGAPAPLDDAVPAIEQTTTPAVAPTAVMPPASLGAALPPQQAQPTGKGRPKRTGVIVGSAAAVIVVLAGAGVGLWLGLRGDDGTTAAGSTTTAVDGPGTVATIPGLEGGTGTTGPAGGLAGYRIAVEDLIRELDFDNGRIPELADMINASTPDVPQGVYDDLAMMLQRTLTAHDAVAEITPPPAFEEATLYLMQATVHMEARIQATMDGIQAGWDTGSTSAARPFYNEGREERDAYLASMEQFFDYVPQGTLPGD